VFDAAGDAISFQYYDASEDEILSTTTSYTYVINDVQGNLLTGGFEINIDDGSCPACENNDAAMAAFGGCAGAVAALGCDFVFGGAPVGDSCPISCGTCPEEDECGVCNGDGSSCDDDEADDGYSVPQSMEQAIYSFSSASLGGVSLNAGDWIVASPLCCTNKHITISGNNPVTCIKTNAT
jgi:hypothetical protein